jgi:hypothetical protein
VTAIRRPVSDVSSFCGEGDRLPFIGQGEGDLQACAALFLYVEWYGIQCRGVDGCPGESCSSHGVVACPVLEQGRPRGWRRGG